MEKKEYRKPKLNTRKIDLGVYGDYTDQGGRDESGTMPVPVEVVRDLNLRME